MPKYEEPIASTKARYEQIVKDLADKHLNENLLLVTHGMYHIQFLVHNTMDLFYRSLKYSSLLC